MLNDLDVIVKTFPREWDCIRVYAIGDVHVGSPQYDDKTIRRKIQIIKDDPQGVVCLCGDLGDYGLKTSKTNVYQATMQPKEQQEYIFELFQPIADKIVAAVPGNHEERITKEVGICPMYDLCLWWRVPEAYRENVAIMKLSFGSVGSDRQSTVVGVVTHGSTRNKHHRFIACFDGIDFAISGHTHTPEYSPHGKIRVDSHRASAKHVAYKEIVVDANMKPGGYALKKEYEIAPPPELQYLEIMIHRDPDSENRRRYRVMNYHAIQI